MQTAELLASRPGVQKAPSPKLDLFIRRGFLTPEQCAPIIAMIDRQRRPSTIADDMGDPAFRTSETCDLSAAEPAVAAIDARIAALTGLDPAHGEPMQGQRYAVGQEFKAHTDYFETGGLDYAAMTRVAGQRTWTVMIYLNEPEAGRRDPFQDDRQDRPARDRQAARLEQSARPTAAPTSTPSITA
jgi:prolyl 4-hydroxylase